MPPVLGPRSPSKTGLWSWVLKSGMAVRPSVRTMKVASSPAKNSSTTTRLPWSPNSLNSLLIIIRWIALATSFSVLQTKAPLPAARPSALTTQGKLATAYFLAFSGLSKISNSAVGIPYFFMNFLARTLLPSNWAAASLGPTIPNPKDSKISTIPLTKGASGPTTVRSISLSLAKRAKSKSLSAVSFGKQ